MTTRHTGGKSLFGYPGFTSSGSNLKPIGVLKTFPGIPSKTPDRIIDNVEDHDDSDLFSDKRYEGTWIPRLMTIARWLVYVNDLKSYTLSISSFLPSYFLGNTTTPSVIFVGPRPRSSIVSPKNQKVSKD